MGKVQYWFCVGSEADLGRAGRSLDPTHVGPEASRIQGDEPRHRLALPPRATARSTRHRLLRQPRGAPTLPARTGRGPAVLRGTRDVRTAPSYLPPLRPGQARAWHPDSHTPTTNRVWAYSSEVLLPASLSSEVVGHKVVKFGPVYEV
jgi:hypothetical protein